MVVFCSGYYQPVELQKIWIKGNNTMKVCNVVMNSVWYDPRVRRQIIEYKKHDIDVCCVGYKCQRYDAKKIQSMPIPVDITEVDKRFQGKQNFFGKIARRYQMITRVRDAIIKTKPDIIHANDFDALIPAYMARKDLGCHLIYDSHEIYMENISSRGRLYSSFAWFLKQVEKRLVKNVDLMICVSHAAADYFEKTYHIQKPMVVTNCALASDFLLLQNVDKHEGFEVLNHGQFYEGRGYDIMAHACDSFQDYPDIRLALRGYGKMENTLRDIVAQCAHKEQFVFYPGVLVQELIPLASKSHVGVAITEGICLNFQLSVSNKIFEYAAAGLPVIMSDIPEHRYLNNKYHFGLVLEENTPEAFSKAVKKLHDDKQLYAQMSENAQKMSREINWENEFAKLLDAERMMMSMS